MDSPGFGRFVPITHGLPLRRETAHYARLPLKTCACKEIGAHCWCDDNPYEIVHHHTDSDDDSWRVEQERRA